MQKPSILSKYDIPSWPGAAITYKRLIEINAKLSKQAYEAGKMINGVYCWTMPKAVLDNTRAMSEGDKEACHAGVNKNFHLVKENFLDFDFWSSQGGPVG